MTVVSLCNVQSLDAEHAGGMLLLLALIAAMCNSRAYLRHRRPLLCIRDGKQQGESC